MRARVARHHLEIGADERRQVGLVDDQQVRLRDARPALARDLVAAGHVDDVDGEVGELAAELRGQVVAAALDEQQLRPEPHHQLPQRIQVLAHIVADGGVRAAAGLHGGDALGRKRAVAHQELAVLLREDVVGHDREAVVVAQQPAERQQQRRLAAADRAADADRERARAEVAGQRRVAPVEQRQDRPARRGRADACDRAGDSAWDRSSDASGLKQSRVQPIVARLQRDRSPAAVCARSSTTSPAHSSGHVRRATARRPSAAAAPRSRRRSRADGGRQHAACRAVQHDLLRGLAAAGRAPERRRPRAARRAHASRRRAPSAPSSAADGQTRAAVASSVRPWTRLARLATALVRNASASASSASSAPGVVECRVHQRQHRVPGLQNRRVDEVAQRLRASDLAVLPGGFEPPGMREQRPSGNAESTTCQVSHSDIGSLRTGNTAAPAAARAAGCARSSSPSAVTT